MKVFVDNSLASAFTSVHITADTVFIRIIVSMRGLMRGNWGCGVCAEAVQGVWAGEGATILGAGGRGHPAGQKIVQPGPKSWAGLIAGSSRRDELSTYSIYAVEQTCNNQRKQGCGHAIMALIVQQACNRLKPFQ